LADGRRLGELMLDGKGMLLDFDVHGPLRALAGRWGDRMTYVASDTSDRLGLSAVLIRPDGVVAWVSEEPLTPDRLLRLRPDGLVSHMMRPNGQEIELNGPKTSTLKPFGRHILDSELP